MRITGLLVFLAVLVGGMAAYYFSPTEVKKRQVRTSLQIFADAVATKDRASVSNALGMLLTEDAKVRLTVHFFSIGNSRPAMDQNFNKASFITFIDNILYTLTDYSYTPTLTSLDKNTGAVKFTSAEWADGANMMGGIAVNMRYGSDTECEGRVVFEGDIAKLAEANCNLKFRQTPKPGQEGKFLGKNLQDLVGK